MGSMAESTWVAGLVQSRAPPCRAASLRSVRTQTHFDAHSITWITSETATENCLLVYLGSCRLYLVSESPGVYFGVYLRNSGVFGVAEGRPTPG